MSSYHFCRAVNQRVAVDTCRSPEANNRQPFTDTHQWVMITDITSAGKDVTAYFAKANNAAAPVVILIHEWWGLNGNIKAMVEGIRATGFHALAIDLFNGSVATN